TCNWSGHVGRPFGNSSMTSGPKVPPPPPPGRRNESSELALKPDSPPCPPPPGTWNAPSPGPPCAVDWVVRKLAVPPSPPPTCPAAPGSGKPAVPNELTPRLFAPLASTWPWIRTLGLPATPWNGPEHRILHGWGPWMSSVPLALTVKLRM